MGELKLTTEPNASTFDVIDWISRGAIAVAYIVIGFSKLRPDSSWRQLFADIGLGQWFRYFTGIVQLLGAFLIFVPRTARIGGAMLACTMAGAVFVHLF